MEKKWIINEPTPDAFYKEHPEISKPVADLLYQRGLTDQQAIDEFLYPDYSCHVHDPFLFSQMHKATDRILEAVKNGEHIVVYGDYDADGVCASVIITSTLQQFGATKITNFLPHRETDGYGLNEKNIHFFAQDGVKLIITCDCGISNAPEVALAKTHGIDVIVTDHHTIPETLPEAFAILHPKLDSESYPDHTLAGGGVAFKLAQGLLQKHANSGHELVSGETHEAFEKWLLDMVAISSVADMVPLLGESRTLTKYGLIVLQKTRRIGLQKLYLEAGILHEDGTFKREIDAGTIGFQIAPRINAAGRLDHSNVAFKLLMTEDPIAATDLAFALENNNSERKQLTKEYLEQAVEQIETTGKDEKPILIVHNENWSSGLVGLIASRLMDKYHKPAIATTLRDGQIVGSGRSLDSFNMIGALQSMPELFTKFGGHPCACGFTLADNNQYQEFKDRLYTLHKKQTQNMDLSPALIIDAIVDLDDVNWELYDTLLSFEPFGMDNPQPLYGAKHVEVFKVESLGKDKNHLKLTLKTPTGKLKTALGWRMCGSDTDTNWCTLLKTGDQIDVAFELESNEWNGNKELRIKIVDLKKSK
ncbi:single-stranded-DNA-specific exonuclease RecJ [Candidatus Nomurabacteria bacterium]|nr:single-stranded-DNA-specific exonuclease RecJ [Candidatus Nomurabacteria bacterium]